MAQSLRAPARYHILMPIGDPDQLTVSLALAVPLARVRAGHVTPLFVGSRDEPPPWLLVPPELRDVVAEPLVLVDRDVPGAILDTVRELKPDLLLLNWRGQPSRGRYLLGRTLDPVIQYAPCDVAVVRAGEKPNLFAQRMAQLKRMVVPAGGGPNASLALKLALDLTSDAEITALRIADRNLAPTVLAAQWALLQEVLEPLDADDKERVRPHLALAPGVVPGIVEEAEHDYDLVLVGATAASLVDRLLFGNIPQELGSKLPQPLVIVRRHDPGGLGVLRRAGWYLFNILPHLTLDERVTIYRQVRRNARAGTDFYVMITLAAAIASLGLLLNSPAVIIGAMIVAPLMSALLGISLGVIQGDVWLLRLSLRTMVLGVLLVLLVSMGVAIVAPGQRITAEMLGRGSPSLLDLAVALVSGAAGAYAICRRNVASALPGVAVAVALVPPLATVGLALIFGEQQISLGAALLFLTNLVAIVSAASLVFLWMGFRLDSGERGRVRTFHGGLVGTTILLVGITLVLSLLTVNSIQQTVFRSTVQRALEEQIGTLGNQVVLSDWEIVSNSSEGTAIEVSVQASRNISLAEVTALQEQVARHLGRTVSLVLTVIPTTRLDPYAPPTAVPTTTAGP